MKTIQENPTDVHKRMLDTAKDFLDEDKALAREIILQVAEEIREVMMAEERAKIFDSYRDTLPSGVYDTVMRPDYDTEQDKYFKT